MTYEAFLAYARERGWTDAQLRGDVPLPDAVFDLVAEIGLGQYERHVSRYLALTRPPEAVPCKKCHAKAGEPCTTYRGARKPTCRGRGLPEMTPPERPEPPAAPTLFPMEG